MKKTLTTCIFIFIVGALSAQQDAQFSQWMFNKLDMNPGFAGTDKSFCATALYRDQWVSFPGAPKTGLFSIDAYLPPLLGGVGLTLCSDQLGFEKTFIGELAYSYHKVLGPGTLGIGINAGFIQQSLSGQWVSTDPYQLDQAIPSTGAHGTTYDIGLGLYYTTDNGMFFGLSSTHLPENTVSSGTIAAPAGLFTTSNGTSQQGVASKLTYELARHYYVMAGYPIQINADYKVIPSILAKTDGASTQLDINGRIVWQNKVWFGVSYRITDAVIFMAGIQWQSLKVGYSYDLTTSSLSTYSNGTHELMLSYCFKPFKPAQPSEHRNPRFL